MKSFDKFQYDQTDLQELKIGEKMSSVGNAVRRKVTGTANKFKTALQRRSNTITQKGAMGAKMRRSPELKRQAIERDRADAQKPINKNPNLRVGEPIKTNNPTGQSSSVDANKTTAITKYKEKGIKKFKGKSGIQQVMDRTKKKIKSGAESQTGRAVGRAAAGAAKAIFNYNPDKERTDTGQGGMGTAKRQRSGFLKSAIKGGVDAPAERINPKQRKTLGGKLLALGKERAQMKVGITPTARTLQGRKLTGGTSRKTDRERTDQLAASGAKGESQVTGDTSDFEQKKEKIKSFVKSAPTLNTQLTDKSDKEISQTKASDNERSFTSDQSSTTDQKGNRKISSMNPDEKARRGIGGGSTSGSDTEGSGGANTNNTRVTGSTPVVTSGNKRPTDVRQGQRNRRRTKKVMAQTTMRRNKDFQNANTVDDSKEKQGKIFSSYKQPMNLTKILEANRIAAEREIKNQYGSVTNAQMRTPAQMRAAENKKKILQKSQGSVMQNDESYSHWREEFIWETDKKYPEKMKEIKPMSGKNTITINPEDETSKYKRGY